MLFTIFIFLVETLWSPKTMSLIKFPKVWVSMTAIIFCLCILWKACITWHFWATNRKLTFSWKITPLGAIPPLKLLQKRAVRVMSGSRYNAHTDPLFKKLHLVKISDLFTVNVYKIYYKLRHVSLPTYVANMFKDFLRNHEHETRQALILDEPNVNTSNGENCIWYLLPRIINKTNHTIVTMVDTYSYQGFVNFVKNDMIGHYIANCSISNCYICNHTHSEWLPLTYSEWVSFNKNKNIIK